MNRLKGYTVWVDGYREDSSWVKALTAGKAKSEYHSREAINDFPFTRIRARRSDNLRFSPQLKDLIQRYNLVDKVYPGSKIRCGRIFGEVIGSRRGSLYVVDEAGKYHYVHPTWNIKYYDEFNQPLGWSMDYIDDGFTPPLPF